MAAKLRIARTPEAGAQEGIDESPGPLAQFLLRRPRWRAVATAGLALAALMVLLTLLDIPAFTGYYLHHDDIHNWGDPPGSNFFRSLDLATNAALGRPLGARLLGMYWSLAPTVQDVDRIRMLSALNLAIFGLLLWKMLSPRFTSSLHAFLLACAILALPGFQIFVIFASGAYLTCGVLLAGTAAFIGQRDPRWLAAGRGSRHFWLGLAMLALFVASLMTHQSAAMVYWVPLAAVALASCARGETDWKQRIWFPMLIGILGMIIYFAYVKLSVPKTVGPFKAAYQPQVLTTDPVAKLGWFFREICPMVLNLWRVDPSVTCAVIVAAFVALAGLIGLARSIRRCRLGEMPWRSVLDFLLRGGVLFGLCVLAFSPNLAASDNVRVYRCTGALAAIVAIAVYKAVTVCVDLACPTAFRKFALNGLLAAGFLFAVFQTQVNVLRFVRRDTAELLYIKTTLAESLTKDVQAICVIYPVTAVEPDEFHFTTCMSPGHAWRLVFAAMYELHRGDRIAKLFFWPESPPADIQTGIRTAWVYGKNGMVVPTIYAPPPDAVDPRQSGPVLVINMRSLSRQLFPGAGVPLPH